MSCLCIDAGQPYIATVQLQSTAVYTVATAVPTIVVSVPMLGFSHTLHHALHRQAHQFL